MILITGASGFIGSAVLQLLHKRGVLDVVACSRSKDKIPPEFLVRQADYEDPASLAPAFADVQRLLFIPADGFAPSLIRQNRNVIEAAKHANVGHLVFLSIVDIDPGSPFYYTPVYRDAEAHLRDSGIPHTILRCGLYADFVYDAFFKDSSLLDLPAELARVALISRNDIARAAASVLQSARDTAPTTGTELDLTGPESMSFAELAATVQTVTGRQIPYRDCDPAEYLLRLWQTMEDPWPHAFSSLFASIRQGRFSGASDDFQLISGKPPETFYEFLARRHSDPDAIGTDVG